MIVVAIVGSTGFVGRHLARRLAAEGAALRCVARDLAKAATTLPQGVPAVRGDVLNMESLLGALTGAETLVHCAAVTADHKEAYPEQYRRVHAEGTRNLVSAAKQAGVKRIVLMNGLGTRRGTDGSYMRTRWEMGEAVRTSGLGWVALQPSILFGDGAAFTAAFARLARRSPVMPLLAGGRLKLQPLWVEDLVTCLVRCIGESQWDGSAMDLGGPEYLTMEEVIDLVMATIGVRRPKLPLPLPIARVQARLMSVLPNPPLVPATLELFDFDNITDLDAVQKTFGFTPRSIREYAQRHGVE